MVSVVPIANGYDSGQVQRSKTTELVKDTGGVIAQSGPRGWLVGRDAVGSLAFVENVKNQLGVRAMHRDVIESDGHALRRGSTFKVQRSSRPFQSFKPFHRFAPFKSLGP
jgi:hypothetical protein